MGRERTERERNWISARYFKHVPTKAICKSCGGEFEYVKTTKPRLYCIECAVEVQETRIRENNEWLRQMRREQS